MYFEVDGHRVFAAGRLVPGVEAPPIIFVHGAAMDHTVWVYHTRYFMHVGRSVAALDLPAHGRSGGEPLASIEAQAEWLLRCLDSLGIERAAVAGHSMGALAALQLAGQAPARVASLALLGAGFPMGVSEQLLAAAKAESPAARDMMMLWGHGPGGQIGSNPVAGIHFVNTAMRLLERARPGLLHNDLKACNDYAGGFDVAPAITARTTLICGRDDKMTPPALAAQLAQRIQKCAISTVRGSGHIMMSEQPEQTHRHLVAALA